jgi:mono/diheme cytochrome c family protein
MAPFGATQSDEWVASVLTYTRREWGNQASTILPADVAKVREHFHDRQTPWTQTDLEEEPSE